MQPAAALVSAATMAVAAILLVDLVATAARNACLLAHRVSRAAGGSAAVAAAVAIVMTLLRPSVAFAVTSPPTARIAAVSGAEARGVHSGDGDLIRSQGREYYVVQKGDSLWRIARLFLRSRALPASGADVARFWRAIYEENGDVIGSDPDLIHPGQVLTIPEV